MMTDSVMAIFSTTNVIAGTTALQLVEEGKLDLDAPGQAVRTRDRPKLGARRIRRRWKSGAPCTHSAIPIRCSAHSGATSPLSSCSCTRAGFGCDFSNEQYNRLATEQGQPSIVVATCKSLMNPPRKSEAGWVWQLSRSGDAATRGRSSAAADLAASPVHSEPSVTAAS